MKLATVPMMTLIALAAASGCGARKQERAYEYMPDMARSPSYKAYAPNAATRDGQTLQRPVEGTIPRGFRPFHFGPGEDEAARAGRELTNPYHATPQVLGDGKALFTSYCQVCHGDQGHGDGPIATKIPPPSSYTSARVMSFPPGRIFHVVTLGSGKMPSHATQLTADERWKIITYIRNDLQGLGEFIASERVEGTKL